MPRTWDQHSRESCDVTDIPHPSARLVDGPDRIVRRTKCVLAGSCSMARHGQNGLFLGNRSQGRIDCGLINGPSGSRQRYVRESCVSMWLWVSRKRSPTRGAGAVGNNRAPTRSSMPRSMCVCVCVACLSPGWAFNTKSLLGGLPSQSRASRTDEQAALCIPWWAHLTFPTWAGLRHCQPRGAASASLASRPIVRQL